LAHGYISYSVFVGHRETNQAKARLEKQSGDKNCPLIWLFAIYYRSIKKFNFTKYDIKKTFLEIRREPKASPCASSFTEFLFLESEKSSLHKKIKISINSNSNNK
jgi:hypothetical protein